jgi:hypothetical protein
VKTRINYGDCKGKTIEQVADVAGRILFLFTDGTYALMGVNESCDGYVTDSSDLGGRYEAWQLRDLGFYTLEEFNRMEADWKAQDAVRQREAEARERRQLAELQAKYGL